MRQICQRSNLLLFSPSVPICMCDNANTINAGASCFSSKVNKEDMCGFTNTGGPANGNPIEDCRAACLKNPSCTGEG